MKGLLLIAVVASVGWVVWLLFDRLRRQDRVEQRRRDDAAEAEARTADALDREGFLPADPIVVDSAASVEARAEALPCPICSGRLHTEEHSAPDVAGERLRRLTMRCGSCGRQTALFFRVDVPVVN